MSEESASTFFGRERREARQCQHYHPGERWGAGEGGDAVIHNDMHTKLHDIYTLPWSQGLEAHSASMGESSQHHAEVVTRAWARTYQGSELGSGPRSGLAKGQGLGRA